MKHTLNLILGLLATSGEAAVNVFVQDCNGRAAIHYECTAGEMVRSFALNVSVSQGHIVGISHYFRGPSTVQAQGYGIFPAAFRDYIGLFNNTNANWNAPGYTPLAAMADDPGNSLPGLNSPGVTLELGALWDRSSPASQPSASGTLCWLKLTEAAQVTVTANERRGGVVLASTGASVEALYSGAAVDPVPLITGISLTNGTISITFKGGELESAPTGTGQWTGTGNSTGNYTTNAETGTPASYFRVKSSLGE